MGARLQWSSKKTLGQRFCLAGYAAGSTGPLMSRGLILTARTIYPLAEILLAVTKDNDFSEERFQIIDDIHQGSLDTVDMLCEGFYASWQDWDLFNA
jgi:FADH2 O2-dependent halogenase